MNKVTVIGAGFAGVEAARQLSRAGIRVTLCEMKPQKFSPAHSSPNFAELVCSNSFKALRTASAAGELKAEMEMLGSLCVSCAKATAVPAGGALAVDRDDFSALVTKTVEEDPLIDIVRGEVTEIPTDGVVIIAAGPLASDALSNEIEKICPGHLSFYDAAAPIVSAQSLDMSCAFKQSRYDRGGEDDYINCPMDKEEYEAFYEALVGAESAETHSFDKRKGVYEGCMPIEVMALRGQDTIRFGPMKPVGLRDPRTGHRPWAVLQLRKENSEDEVRLNNMKLDNTEGHLCVGVDKTTDYRLEAIKHDKVVATQRLVLRNLQSIIKCENKKMLFNGSDTINEDGSVEFKGEKGSSNGFITWKAEIPYTGKYYLDISYEGGNPVPSYLYANGKLISENIGYLATTGNKRGNFIFPIDLEKGVNELRLEHPGRRSNKLYTITIAKEIN